MSTYLWTALGLGIIGGVAAIVIAIIGTIEDPNRRLILTTSIMLMMLVIGLACSILIRMDRRDREVPDVA